MYSGDGGDALPSQRYFEGDTPPPFRIVQTLKSKDRIILSIFSWKKVRNKNPKFSDTQKIAELSKNSLEKV